MIQTRIADIILGLNEVRCRPRAGVGRSVGSREGAGGLILRPLVVREQVSRGGRQLAASVLGLGASRSTRTAQRRTALNTPLVWQ